MLERFFKALKMEGEGADDRDTSLIAIYFPDPALRKRKVFL